MCICKVCAGVRTYVQRVRACEGAYTMCCVTCHLSEVEGLREKAKGGEGTLGVDTGVWVTQPETRGS